MGRFTTAEWLQAVVSETAARAAATNNEVRMMPWRIAKVGPVDPVSANDTGTRRLIEMMTEFKLTSLEPLAQHILTTSEKGAREAIKAMPEGEWSYEMPLDGYERELVLKAKLKIAKGKITVDFTGSSAASLFGINSPRTYTHAYAVFGLKA